MRRSGYSPEEAQDLTQGFFALLLERRDLDVVRREKGRLRSYLLSAIGFPNFLHFRRNLGRDFGQYFCEKTKQTNDKDNTKMKKQNNPNIKAHLLRGAFYLLLLVAFCAIPFALAQRNGPEQSVAKLGSASRGLVEVGNALPANIIVVTNTNDSGPGSLRDALSIANDGDTIDATGVSGTILLTSGELQINHNVTINGPGAENLAVNRSLLNRVRFFLLSELYQ